MDPEVSISYAITTNDEEAELQELILLLESHIDVVDEIVIVDDFSTNPTTTSILGKQKNVFFRKLNKDFATQKNFLNAQCNTEYIFQIDADELPTPTLLKNLKSIIHQNQDVDLFYIPRTNIVIGIKEFHIKQWDWKLDDKKRINYPDYQGRLYKNKKEIRWYRPVHEQIGGHQSSVNLPSNSELELIHIKHIEKQVKSNSVYSNDYNLDGTIR